jgi:hypothetical protein
MATASVMVAIALGAHDARADLRQSIGRVADAWRAVGAAVVVDKTRFLNDDETMVFSLPELPEGVCTTVVLLGPRGLGFHARVAESGEDDAGERTLSEAGGLSVQRCGESPPRRLLVTSDSGRGAVETAVARSRTPLPALRGILPERMGGIVVPALEPGVLPPVPSPETRAEIAEARARRDGDRIGGRATWRAGPDGAGGGEVSLDPGCHTLALFALDPRASNRPRRGKLDLDAEMRDPHGRLLARDHAEAPDARLSACVGETTEVGVVFVGSPPNSLVLMAHFARPIPEQLPTIWGSEVRARMAHVLLTRHVTRLPRPPVALVQGGSGATPVPLSMEPGGCYLAVVALVQGVARAVGLRVHVGGREGFDDRGIDASGAAVAFCAGERSQALAEVEARGTPLLGWALAVYRLQAGVWEIPW